MMANDSFRILHRVPDGRFVDVLPFCSLRQKSKPALRPRPAQSKARPGSSWAQGSPRAHVAIRKATGLCGWWRAHNARVFFQLRLHAILGSEELSCRVGEIGWQRQASPLGSGVKGAANAGFFLVGADGLY